MESTARTLAPLRSGFAAVLRAKQWVHFLVLPLASLDLHDAVWPAVSRTFRGVVLAALVLSYAYGLNAISDRRTDFDPQKNPLAGGGPVAPQATALVAIAGALAFGLGALALPIVRLAVAVSLAASTVYSVGPRLKAWRGVGTLVNGAIFLPLLCFASSHELPESLPVLAGACLAMVLQNQLMHERADLLEDAAGHVRTTASSVSEGGVRWLVAGLGALGAASAVILAPAAAIRLVGVAALVATSACVFARGSWPERRRVHRWVAFISGAVLFLAGFAR